MAMVPAADSVCAFIRCHHIIVRVLVAKLFKSSMDEWIQDTNIENSK